ncbi:TetR/AcrR family transcriptional regulator [Priestia flexa]|uniref:TetR/AcrR family transcriptional regulator n=1 Tax=Priestia flexa TaxID=86664 RepID=UPI00077CA098|nr:TetR/AcrR family transcriptional regulator [Priestia flexa]MBY6087276.1 TetR/AcrR family transcriptional regulator [Priestia flexa]MED4589818.1 TetR/AcrR family transcriptional regulator [Priestia flexa]WEZ06879.1 TetR/AcrR family transcriptional regulator [Priestia flexa]
MPKIDRRILKSQESIKGALIELMTEKNFDKITIQDISNRANVNRGTIYLHYLDKFDLLDKIMEEHILNMTDVCESAADMDWIQSTVHCMEYLEENYLFFSTMLASEGARYFRNQFLKFNIQEFRKEVDITQGKNNGQNEEVVVQFVANAYVGIVEWWLKNEMPYPPQMMAEKVGELIERVV